MSKQTTVRRGYADSRIGQLHYVEAGEGPVLLMIPHAGRSSRMYRDVVPLLAKRYRVIVIDVPGTGMSAPPPEGDHEIAEYADWLVDALDYLGIYKLSIFGLHGGNKIGGSIANRHPERIHGFIYAGQSHSIVVSNEERAAILAATPSVAAVVSAKDARDGSPLVWSREFRELTDIWWRDGVVGTPTLANRAALVEDVLESLQAFLYRPFFYRAAFAYDMEAELHALAVPVLVLELTTPREDEEVGRQGESLLRAIPNAELVTLHSPNVYAVTLEDRPAELADIIATFLDRQVAT